MEAAARGLPVIGLDHQGLAALIPDEMAIKVEIQDGPRTVADLARAIEWMAANPEKRRAMGHAAREFAKRNTWEARVRDVYSIINSLTSEARTSG